MSTTGKSISMRNLTYGYAGTARKVEGMTNFKALFGADRRSIAHISRKVATVACTRGREAIELLVELNRSRTFRKSRTAPAIGRRPWKCRSSLARFIPTCAI